MNTKAMEEAIKNYMQANSGYEDHRKYLGLSKISGCPRRAYDEYVNGTTPDETTYRMCFAGYEQEHSILKMLERHNLIRPSAYEIVAPFDARLRGHTDSETVDGDLVEIKSVSTRKFEKVTTSNKPIWDHFVQVQLYMHFGKFKNTFIVYRCRETYEHRVISVPYNQNKALEFESKAKDILSAIDSGVRPECTCGRCK